MISNRVGSLCIEICLTPKVFFSAHTCVNKHYFCVFNIILAHLGLLGHRIKERKRKEFMHNKVKPIIRTLFDSGIKHCLQWNSTASNSFNTIRFNPLLVFSQKFVCPSQDVSIDSIRFDLFEKSSVRQMGQRICFDQA